jgi:hypothetical protein
VYLIWEQEAYESDVLIGVYSSKEIAEKQKELYLNYLGEYEIPNKHVHLQEKEVDENI